MSTNQNLMGVGLILALAVGSQVLASRLRIPVIIVLLPAGFVAGALTTDVNPQRAPPRAGVRATGVRVGGHHPLGSGSEPRHAEAQGPHPARW